MNNNINRENKDPYTDLRIKGYGGWGGEKFEKRRAGWKQTIDNLITKKILNLEAPRTLELGCGNGMISMILAQNGFEVIGVDISETAIAWAEDNFRNYNLQGTFFAADIVNLNIFENETFDIIIDGNCLHCIIGAERQQCLKEIFRVTKPGGILVVSTMCGKPRSQEARNQFDSESHLLIKDGKPHRALLPLEVIKSELEENGFLIIDHSINSNTWWDHATIILQKSY